MRTRAAAPSQTHAEAALGLTPVAAALAAVDPAQLVAAVPAPPPVEPLLAHVSGELARRRRRRFAAAGSAIDAVAAAVLLAVVLIPAGDPPAPTPETRSLRSA